MVKASLMLKVNGNLLSCDTTKVVDLGMEWRNSNPIRGRNIRKRTLTVLNWKTMLIMRTVVLVIMATMAITATVAAASSNF